MNQVQYEARLAALHRVASCRVVLEAHPKGVTVTMLEDGPGGARVLASRTLSDWPEALHVYQRTSEAMQAAVVELCNAAVPS
jgi:hypothetical protein